MSVSRCRSVLISVSIALAACSGSSNAHSVHVQQVQATANSASPAGASGVPTTPAVESTIRALPDFSPLVERYGPAVVNVEVVEKAQPQSGPQGLSPNDPFYDFFKRFGISMSDQGGPRGNAPPVRGAGSGFIVSADGYILT